MRKSLYSRSYESLLVEFVIYEFSANSVLHKADSEELLGKEKHVFEMDSSKGISQVCT
jgi:hypothetical protein